MLNNRPLWLKVAGKKDFDIPISILSLLILYAAAASPQPVAMTLLVILLLGAGWVLDTLYYSNIRNNVVALTLFPDGRVTLICADKTVVQGSVEGRSWCTRWLTVLSIATQGKSRNLLVLSGRQATDEYRRLMVQLRQNMFAVKNAERVQS